MGLFGKLLGAVVPIAGSILGGASNKKSIKNAAAAQLEGQRLAIAEQQRQFDLSRSDNLPFLQAGQQALGQQGDILGLNGAGDQSAALDTLKASPLFQSLFNTGEEAILQNASATGGLRGGNTQRGLADFGADTFSKVIQQQLANLGGIAGQGVGVGATLGNLGANTANNISQSYQQQGNINAGSILGRQAVDNNVANQLAAIFQKITGSFSGGGGF